MMFIKNILLCMMIGFIFSSDYSEPIPPLNDNPDCVCEEFLPIDIWIKISNGSDNYGQIMELDMSKGWSGADMQYVYLYVMDLTTGTPVLLMFPFNDWFETEYIPPNKQNGKTPSPENKEEYFEWLKKHGNSIEIKASIK